MIVCFKKKADDKCRLKFGAERVKVSEYFVQIRYCRICVILSHKGIIVHFLCGRALFPRGNSNMPIGISESINRVPNLIKCDLA